MANSINTNISAFFAQANIGTASAQSSASVSRLSSGNRIVKASDDVAALSTGTSLRTQVLALKTALTNASQGTSLLQVADGALSQVTEILQRQKAISLQAGSGSLTDTDRGFLDQEFQALSTEIDRLTGTTNFNGVKLLNGSLSQAAKVNVSTDTSSAASATIGLSSNLSNGETLVINGVTLTAVTGTPTTAQFAIGATTADTINNFATKLNELASNTGAVTLVGGAVSTYATALGGANYSVTGSTLNITSRTGGSLGNAFTLTAGTSNDTTSKVSIGGQYGGATINLISTGVGFASATAAITDGTASQGLTVPFKAGDTITATIGSSSAVSLYTLNANDSLTNIAAGINSNSATSGFTATIVPSATSGFNIELHTANSTGNISLNGGSNYFATAATGAQTYALNGATSTVNLLSSTLASSTAGASIVGVSASASTPFVDASNLYISVAGGTKVAIAALATGDTVADIVTKINNSATAGALGISAVLSESNNNIAITYNDPAQTTGVPTAVSFSSGLTAGTNNTFNTDALGQNKGSGLNGAYVTFNLLATGLNAPDTAAVAANGAGTSASPLEAGTAISVAFNTDATTLGSAIAILNSGSVTAGLTLQQIAGAINADADSIAKGIHAQVIQDAGGKYNVQIQYASSAVPTAGTGGTASATGIKLTYDNSTIGGTGAYTPTAALNNSVATPYSQANLFATGFTTALGGQYVVSAGAASNGSANIPFGSDAIITLTSAGSAVSSAITVGAGATIQSIVDQINNNTTAQGNGVTAEVVSNGITANIRIKVADTAHTGVTAGVVAFSVTNAVQTNDFGTHAIQTGAATYVSGSSVATTTNTTYRLFNSSFASSLSAGQIAVGTAASALKPFQAGEALTVDLNNGAVSVNILATVASADGDTLADLVNKINAGTGTSNFSATLDGNGTNILLKYEGTTVTNARASFTGGANFFNNKDLTAGSTNNTNGFNNSYSTVNLFTNVNGIDTVAGPAGPTYVIAASSATAAIPFDSDVALNITGVGAISLTITTTLQDLVNSINTDATAKTNGVHATLVNTVGTSYQIVLSYADTANTGLLAGPVTATNVGYDNTLGGALPSTTATTLVAVDSILQKASTLTANTDNGAVGLTNNGSFGLVGGSDTGIGYGSVSVTGTVADTLITGLSQNKAKSFISFPDIDPAALTDTGNFGSAGSVYVTVGGHNFSFVVTASAPDEIEIGASLKETLDNAVSTINKYAENTATGDVAYQLNQINVSRSGNSLVLEGKGISNVKTIGGTDSAVAISSAFTNGATVSSANLSNSSRSGTGAFGVDVSGVSNKDFTGEIQGFTATYAGSANTVNLSVKVGDYTYSANNVNTNPISGDKVIRFLSDQIGSGASATNGGFFDVQLSNNNGQTINPSTSSADTLVYQQRVNAAFNGLDFAQSREISSYSGAKSITSGNTLIGSLLGSSVSAKLGSYDAVKLTNIEVVAPAVGGADASIKLTIGGEQYNSSGLGDQLGANQTYRFTNTTDSSKYVELRTGNTAIDLSTADFAKAVKDALAVAFGVSNGAGALSFQVGSSSSDTLNVSIGSAKTSDIYGGLTLNVLSQANAVIAGDQLDKALVSVTTLRAAVGALQSRFNFAAANIQIAVQNQDAARGELLDTDVATESTAFATSQVKIQAGISVLAQANQQLQNLLKLIQ